MKILYFGTVCKSDEYKNILSRSHANPSAAPFTFETALTEGFYEHGADLEVFSFPVIPAFPKSPMLFIKGLKNKLDCGYPSSWISCLNITGLKQLTQKLSSSRMLKKWLKENSGEEKVVLIYSIYQPIAKSIVTLCKKTGTPCFAIVPDLPRDMYANVKTSLLKQLLSGIYTKSVEKVQGGFDGYIYLTEYMKEIINPVAPYTVVEGISKVPNVNPAKKSTCRSIMYAGTLNEKMGIKILLDAFSKIPDEDMNLWLFGGGDCVATINAAAEKDTRIKYFGYKNRTEILQYEQQSHLLINLRNPEEEYTKYSFPSKTTEYMASGTPLLTTKLRGIPDEYFDYCFTLENYSADDISRKIREILALPIDELNAFGQRARVFIKENKNQYIQSGKILNFIEEHVKRSASDEYKN